MARWQVEPPRTEPALRSIFEGRDWSAPSRTVREPARAWTGAEVLDPPQGRAEEAPPIAPEELDYPLGIARGQIAETYIVAEAEDALAVLRLREVDAPDVAGVVAAVGEPIMDGQ